MPRSLDPDTLVYQLTGAADPQLSPDGTRILYTLQSPDRTGDRIARRLTTIQLDGSDPRLLDGEGNDEWGRWSPDGTQIAFVSEKDSAWGVCVRSEPGDDVRELTRHTRPVGELAWSPDGSRIAYTTLFDPANPDEEKRPEAPVRVANRLDYKQDGRGFVGDVRSQLFVVDVESGERRRLSQGNLDRRLPQWSPDSAKLAVQLTNGAGWSQLEIIDLASEEAVVVGPETGVVGLFSWSPRGERILILGEPELTYQPDLFIYDVAAGDLRRLTDDLDVLPEVGSNPPLTASHPVWLDERQVLLHAIRGGASGLCVVDTATGDVREIARWEARHVGLSLDRQRQHAVQAVGSVEGVAEVGVFNPRTSALSVITHHTDEVFAAHPPARPERFSVRREGFSIDAWLLKPADLDESRRHPLILDVHGGPNNFYGPTPYPLMQCLATHGFVVVYANPRGSTSYGRRFARQVHGDWGGEDYLDLMAVVDAALERPYVDPDRTGIYGYSFGGFMTAWTIGQTDRFKAAVCGAPCFDLESHCWTADIALRFARVQWGGTPDEIPDWYATRSPSKFVHRAVTPTLIIQGEADERCPVGQGQEMYAALINAGCEVEMALYPGASHLFFLNGRPSQREDFLARVLDWFERHLMHEQETAGES